MKNNNIFKNNIVAFLYLVFFNSLYLYYYGLEAIKYYYLGFLFFSIHLLFIFILILRHLYIKNYSKSKSWGLVALTLILNYLILYFIIGEIDLHMHLRQI